MNRQTDILIVGTGAAGLYAALTFPADKNILMISKDTLENCDSFLAQGGICVLKDASDYDEYFEDTMIAGHHENNRESVDIMLRSSQEVIADLISNGVEFEKENGGFLYTREGGHRSPRILFHADETGKEITGKLLAAVQRRPNITLLEHTTMIDILARDNTCYGIVMQEASGAISVCTADYTILACGGLGGLFRHSTNFRHITGDAIAIALKHGIALQNVDYIQIHPTILYSEKPGRRFLISESVRGEGAHLRNAAGERFVNELLPRDVVTKAIQKQMAQDGTSHVWLDMRPIPKDAILSHFPNIYKQCLQEGYDCTREWIPVVPAQHYFMGGIQVDTNSQTSMQHLYAAGETSCNGVHGANRLASNSLLESLVFAGRAGRDIQEKYQRLPAYTDSDISLDAYADTTQLLQQYKDAVRSEIERMKKEHESHHDETSG